jgi:hypothetical protein
VHAVNVGVCSQSKVKDLHNKSKHLGKNTRKAIFGCRIALNISKGNLNVSKAALMDSEVF